jgi:dTDP-glucose pyrophosphorylase
MTDRWREAIVPAGTPLLEAIAALDATGLQILLVVDDDGRLVGTVTDGDVRRGILAQRPLDGPVADVMHATPTTGTPGMARDEARRAMRDARVRQLPLLDEAGRPAGLELLDDGTTPDRPNPVVIMAGGLGKRLRPLTEELPKPLLRVGGRPLLETIIEAFADHGFRRFHLSVNYRAAQVEEHFGDGRRLGVAISYLREDEFLGTAGALSLLPDAPSEPVVVMNGDILTRVDFGQLIEFHVRTGAEMTMCVREYDVEVPYGVVEVDGERVTSLVEKPTTRHFINAGIYVLAPQVVATIAAGRRLDMTDLADRIIERGGTLSAFPIREYWLDIGHLEDFERAQADFAEHFR